MICIPRQLPQSPSSEGVAVPATAAAWSCQSRDVSCGTESDGDDQVSQRNNGVGDGISGVCGTSTARRATDFPGHTAALSARAPR